MYVVTYYLMQDGYQEVYGPFKTKKEALAWMEDDFNNAKKEIENNNMKFNSWYRFDGMELMIDGFYKWSCEKVLALKH